MIYLLLDSYLDDQDNLHKVLKIGYSKDKFEKTRKQHYDTHNYGYKFLGEREGDIELETYLHKRYNSLRLSREWFQWDQKIIDEFQSISIPEDNITKEEYLEEIKKYIISKMLSIPEKLKKLYLKELLEELKETYDTEIEYQCFLYDESLLKQRILYIWELVYSKEYEFWSSYDLKTVTFNLPQIISRQRLKENVFKEDAKLFYKILKSELAVFIKGEFEKYILGKRKSTEIVLNGYQKLTEEEKRENSKIYKRDASANHYSDNFIGVSRKTGTPTYNYLVEIADHKSLEVMQKENSNISKNCSSTEIKEEIQI